MESEVWAQGTLRQQYKNGLSSVTFSADDPEKVDMKLN